ncbi:MAG: hypothetical protein HYY76_15460 [Acidobacteria bacterium]|nr:hypothetical protein [Acidobacteriota bacterium]
MPACDLRGHTLFIKDHTGAGAGSVGLTEFDGQTNQTSDLVMKAPVEAGEYTWVAVCPAVVKDDVSYIEARAPISFTVKPHTTSVVVWDIPSAVVVSEQFRIKVGIKCSSECGFANSRFGVYDHEGARVATGTLPGDRWPGTTGLYVAEVELDAPAGEGLYTWSIRAPEAGVGIPHADGSSSFGVRVVSRPEHLVVVEAIDKESQTPLAGARVVMHPYKAVSDERGIAEVRVVKGPYKLFVSQTRYLTFGLPVEVDADMRARAELSLEPVPERN